MLLFVIKIFYIMLNP